MLGSRLLDILGHNWALLQFIVAMAAIAFVCALVLLKYVRISLNIMRTTKPPLSRYPLDFEPLRGEAVSFPAFDGSRLAGMLVRAPAGAGAPRGLIIFAHEFCADMHSCARYVRPLCETGYDVLSFDFRGHGQSDCEPDYTPRQWVTDRELTDIRGALAFAEEWLRQQGRADHVGLFGISRGACAAILAAEENPAIRAIVADGAFSTDRVIEHLMKRWAYIFASVKFLYENHPPAFWRFLRWCMMGFARHEFRCTFPSVYKSLNRMTPRPILFIHGEKDSYLPVEQSRLLYAIAGQPKSLWIVPGARHNQAAVLRPDEYARNTIRFFDRYLAGIESPASPKAESPAEAAGALADAMTPDLATPVERAPVSAESP